MKRHVLAIAAVLAATLAAGHAFAQTPPALIEVELDGASSATSDGEVDPAALSALEKMTLYLGTLKSFEVTTTSTVDTVLESGQKLQFDGGGTYKVKRPNAFYIETHTDRRVRQFFYDGKTFTIYSPRMGLYSQIAAPDTIREVVKIAEDDYDISFPLADLFHWGETPEDVKSLTSAMHVGYAKLNGIDCDQYAFRQDRVDWQVWIQKGDTPLPRKLVITTREDLSMPQFTAFISWNTSPQFDAATFGFDPPAGTYKAEIVRITAAN